MLYEYSYQNLMLYAAATPAFDDEEDTWNPEKDWNNPSNNTDTTDEEEFIKEY